MSLATRSPEYKLLVFYIREAGGTMDFEKIGYRVSILDDKGHPTLDLTSVTSLDGQIKYGPGGKLTKLLYGAMVLRMGELGQNYMHLQQRMKQFYKHQTGPIPRDPNNPSITVTKKKDADQQ